MINQSLVGLCVLRHILTLPVKEAGDALGKCKPFLTYAEDQSALGFIQKHLSHHGQMPHPDTVLDQANVFLPEAPEPLGFYLERLKARYISEGMHAASDKASALLQEGKETEALSAILADLLPLTQDHGGHNVFDFRQTEDSALAHYKAQLAGNAPPVQKLGYPTIDAQGGLEDGDMLALVGRPGSGKTFLMLWLALTCWQKWQEPILFVTQEMSAPQIEKRALPIIAGVNPTPLYKGEPLQYQLHGITPEQYLAKLDEAAHVLKNAMTPFLIYDSKMAGTVADIEAIAAVHGVRRVWIDGAYMLRHPDPRLGRYARVPENLDLLKYWCQRTGTMCFSSWQFKRGSGKNDAVGDTPDLDDIGYSHAIGEYMSVVMGLLENPKSVTEINKKRVTIMKGRNGEVGSFDVLWDFEKMEFKEATEEQTEDVLHYL